MSDKNKKYLNGEGLAIFYNILNNEWWQGRTTEINKYIIDALGSYKLPHTLTVKDDVSSFAFDGGDSYTLKAVNGLKLSNDANDSSIYHIGHSNLITAGSAKSEHSGGTLNYGDEFTIPEITYDSFGHITGIGQTKLTMPDKENYHLPLASNGVRGGIQTGYQSTSSKGSYYNIPLLLDKEKAYTALTKDIITTTLGYTPISTDQVDTTINDKIKDIKPLKFKGNVGVSPQLELPTTHEVGDVWVVGAVGTFAGQLCEIGDLIICKTAGTTAVNEHWTVVQNNWSAEKGTASLDWGATTTLAKIGGIEINATMPNQPVIEEGKISDKLNVTNLDDIKAAQASVTTERGVKFFIISDSNGRLPSKDQNAVSVSSECIRQLSLASPNASIQNILLKNISADNFKARGMSVGDVIALARVKVKLDDLCTAIKLSSTVTKIIKTALKFGGLIDSTETLEVYQYKVWSTTGTRWKNYTNPDGSVVEEGVEGLFSVWDKELVDKILPLETQVNESTKMVSRWCLEARKCLETGVYPYVNRELVVREWNPETNSMDIVSKDLMMLNTEIGPDATHEIVSRDDFWGTVITNASTTPDGGGYYTVEQTLYSRAGYFNGVDFKRMFFYQCYTEEDITALQESYVPENYGGMVFDEYMHLTNQAWRLSNGLYVNLATITGDFMWYPVNSYLKYNNIHEKFKIDDNIISNINNDLYNKGIIEDPNNNTVNDDGYIVPSSLSTYNISIPRRYRGVSGMDDTANLDTNIGQQRLNIIGSGSVVTMFMTEPEGAEPTNQKELIIHSKATIDTAMTDAEIKKAINYAIPGLIV